MDQIGNRQIAFLSICISMVLVGALGLAGWVSARVGLLVAILIALVAVSFSADVFYAERLA